jgi:adenine-specific DNA-methyltransferase
MNNDKLPLQSPDGVQDNIGKIAALFPHCITETAEGRAVDFDLLRQTLSPALVEGQKERYRLEWPGKREALVTAHLPTTNTLRPVPEQSVNFDSTQNLYIEGDNLEVLKLLQESYLGRVKMIYIDPPYNTGNDFVYRDNFAQDAESYQAESGERDEYNRRLVANPATDGRYHSNWLSMMYPRLKLARNLLKEDGVIFISIDDNEVHNLRKICDEIFGEVNFVANVIWEKKYAPSNDAKWLSDNHDHILLYAKNKIIWRPRLLPRTEEQNQRYTNRDNDSRGVWKSSDLSVKSYSEAYDYPIETPSGRIVHPPSGACWRVSREKFDEMVKDNRIWFGENGDNVPSIKRFLTDVKDGIVPLTIWKYSEVGHNQIGRQELKKLFDGKGYFDGPKPVELISKTLKISGLDDDSIVLDFYSGSATSGQATMEYNAAYSTKCKFILVQLPEKIDEKSEAYNDGYKSICEIGKERIRRAGTKIKTELAADIEKLQQQHEKKQAELDDENSHLVPTPEITEKLAAEIAELEQQITTKTNTLQQLDTGFRVYRLDSSNMEDVYYRPQDIQQENLQLFADNIKPGRTAHDLLAQVMLAWGLPLHLKINTLHLAGKTVLQVAENSLFACFDTGIDEAFAHALAPYQPLRVVFKDAGFATDTAKTNVRQLLKQLSPDTEIKVI